MASAPVPMKGAEQADDALDKAEASLSDPMYDHYDYWKSLSKAEKSGLLDRAHRHAMETWQPETEEGRQSLAQLVTSCLKELVKLAALGVPASTTNSPTGSQGKFGSMSSLNSRQLSPRASIISNMTWSDHSSQRSAGSYDRPASPLTTVKT